MIRRGRASSFGVLSEPEEEVNPIESVVNLFDVMLVFAVALMLALVARSGLDFGSFLLDENSLVPVEDTDQQAGEGASSDGSDDYQEVGRVYRNSDGEMFILEG